MMNQVRWGMIGAGAVTEVKSGPAFDKIEDSALLAVMRRDGDKARDYAHRHGVPKWTTDANELIHDPDVNAIYVATPPGSHADYAIRAMRAGKPVYVEKPMARSYSECQQMLAVAQETGVPLFVAYYRRRLPNFLQVKELLDQGVIGDVRLVTVQLLWPARPADLGAANPSWRVLPEIGGDGYFYDVGSHQLDLLDYFFGPIVRGSGQAANRAGLYPASDVVTASFAFQSGLPGSGVWCFTAPPEQRLDRMEIVGSRGKLTFPSIDYGPLRLETASGVQEFDLPWPEHVQQPLIQSVVDELLGRGACPSSGVSAARTSRWLDAIAGTTG